MKLLCGSFFLQCVSTRIMASQTLSQTKRTLDQVAISQDSSPMESQSKLVKLPGETCSHCPKCFTSKGKTSDSIQCEIRYRWVNASCESYLSKEKYRLFSQLIGKIPNLIYCCKFNQCYWCLNQITSVANHDSPVNISQDLRAISEHYGILKTTVSQLDSQIKELCKSKQPISWKEI